MLMELPAKFVSHFVSPVGLLRLRSNALAITHLDFVNEVEEEDVDAPLLEAVRLQLDAYFNHSLQEFSIPVQPGGTHFQQNVWEELTRIPFGKTISYEHLAKKLGDPKVIRAAAAANGKNPIPIIIPCHRVVGKDGSLTGYSGGIWRKSWLLEHESKSRQPPLF